MSTLDVVVWERIGFWAKLVVLPFAFLGAAGGVIWGAVYISIGIPGQKLRGLIVLAVSLGVWMVGLWLAFGRPAHWFAPGENTEFDPRR